MMRTQDYLDRRWTALILLCAAQFVVVLDASIVNVALPSIGRGLHFSEASLPWVVNGYVIAFGGFLLLGGRAADLLGRRRVFMTGLLVVAVASLGAGSRLQRSRSSPSGVEEHEQGLASGLINTSQQIGGALGLAVLSTIATSRTNHVLATGRRCRGRSPRDSRAPSSAAR